MCFFTVDLDSFLAGAADLKEFLHFFVWINQTSHIILII